MLDRKNLAKMMAEMAALGAKYGVSVTPAGGSIGVGSTDAKIKFAVKELVTGVTGKVEVVVSGRAKSEAKFAGLDIDKKFTSNGKTHRVIDYHPRKYKQPWITEASDGKNYKWSTEQLKRQMSPIGIASAKTVGTDALSHLL